MRKVYLASDSKARRELLKIFGFKFKVLPAKVKEERNCRGRSYCGLVKSNAREKAEAVAKKLKSGIIIAADTIVVQNKKIFGKPENL